MEQFSSKEEASLEKTLNINRTILDTPDEDLEYYYDLSRCLTWIIKHEFRKVCLQFPDFMLNDAPKVALELQKRWGQMVYILGDTEYESCCLDYVAAAHIDADAIIHFGPICFSAHNGNIPSLFIYEKFPFDLDKFVTLLNVLMESKNLQKPTIILDTPYLNFEETLQGRLSNYKINIIRINTIDSKVSKVINNSNVIYIGGNNRKLLNFQLHFKPLDLYYYEDDMLDIQLYQINPSILKRRNFLIETIKDSQTIGIVIGTLAVKNYLKAITRLKQLLSINNKKYYLLSVGKLTVAKLANFPEMDVYVLISCSMNEIFESRDFYKPIVTIHDVETAFNPQHGSNFTFDFNQIVHIDIPETPVTKNDVSLITGKIRNFENEEIIEAGDDTTVCLRPDGTIATTAFGAGYLNERSWKGLDQDLGKTEVKLAEEGRKGIAQCYTNEENL